MSKQEKNKSIKKEVKKEVKAVQKYKEMASGQKQLKTEGAAQRVALKQSAYLQSLLDPWLCPGAKVPDANSAPSFCFQSLSKYVLAAGLGTGGSGTDYGVLFVYRVGYTGNTPGPSAFVKACTAYPTTQSGTYTTGPSSATSQSYGLVAGTQLVAVGQMIRPVSCGISISVQGATQTDQGRIMAAYLPPGDASGLSNILGIWSAATGSASTSSAAMLGATYSVDCAAEKRYLRAIWLPLDDLARVYIAPATVTTNRPYAGAQATLEQYGCLAVMADSMNNGTAVEVTVVENFEVIPVNNITNLVQPEPSVSDPLEMAAAQNYISKTPLIAVQQSVKETTAGTPLAAGVKAGHGVTDTNHPSFMDSVFAGIEKGMGAAKKLAPMAAGLLSML